MTVKEKLPAPAAGGAHGRHGAEAGKETAGRCGRRVDFCHSPTDSSAARRKPPRAPGARQETNRLPIDIHRSRGNEGAKFHA